MEKWVLTKARLTGNRVLSQLNGQQGNYLAVTSVKTWVCQRFISMQTVLPVTVIQSSAIVESTERSQWKAYHLAKCLIFPHTKAAPCCFEETTPATSGHLHWWHTVENKLIYHTSKTTVGAVLLTSGSWDTLCIPPEERCPSSDTPG